jgi:hypothetical protein
MEGWNVMNARMFALAIGIVYLLVGLLGLVWPGGTMITHNGASDADWPRLLGLFPINLLHNIVHLAIGAWGIAAYRSLNGSVAFARALAILYGLLAIMGLIPGLNTTFGLIPIFGHDVWLHAGTALIAAYFGWMAHNRSAVETIDASRHVR